MTELFSGIISAVVTPFDDDGRVNEKELRDLVCRTVDSGINGIAVCGSSGEFSALSIDERKRILAVVVHEIAGNIPVIANISATRIDDVIDLGRHAVELGAAAVMAVQPYYEPMQDDEIALFFRLIASTVDIPVVIYNIPSHSGSNIAPALAARIGRECDNVTFVKDSSGDPLQLQSLVTDQETLTTLVGWDGLAFDGLMLGCRGAVLGAANVIPKNLVELYSLIRKGRCREAEELWRTLVPFVEFLNSGSYIAKIKTAARLRGLKVGEPRPPYLPLGNEEQELLRSLLSTLVTA